VAFVICGEDGDSWSRRDWHFAEESVKRSLIFCPYLYLAAPIATDGKLNPLTEH
jgi:hypothetical protein